jgi:hypothetical protein
VRWPNEPALATFIPDRNYIVKSIVHRFAILCEPSTSFSRVRIQETLPRCAGHFMKYVGAENITLGGPLQAEKPSRWGDGI